jgi:hypothetical protein
VAATEAVTGAVAAATEAFSFLLALTGAAATGAATATVAGGSTAVVLADFLVVLETEAEVLILVTSEEELADMERGYDVGGREKSAVKFGRTTPKVATPAVARSAVLQQK